MPCKRIERNAFLAKPFKRILTSKNGVLANHSNAVFKPLVPNRATHHKCFRKFNKIAIMSNMDPNWAKPGTFIPQKEEVLP